MDSQAEGVLRTPHQLCNVIGNTETDSHPGCVFRTLHQPCNFPENTETDSHPGCIIRTPSHATLWETQRQTYILNVFSGPLISHAVMMKYRDGLTIWMDFQDLYQSMNFPGNPGRNSQSGCVSKTHHQSQNFLRKHGDKLTSWIVRTLISHAASQKTQTDSQSEWVSRISQQSCNFPENIETHSLDVFWGPFISHGASQGKKWQTHILDVFLRPFISHATS